MYCDIHTHNPLPHVPSIIDISDRVDLRFGMPGGNRLSFGIHPRNLAVPANGLKLLETLASAGSISAVGECGLDVFSSAGQAEQFEVFVSQLTIAKKYRLPAIVHCVRLYQEVIRAVRITGFDLPLILHGYNGNQQTTFQLKKLGNVYFSFGRPLTAKQAQAISQVSADRLLTESDTCAETSYGDIIESLAGALGTDCGSMETSVYQNFERILMKN